MGKTSVALTSVVDVADVNGASGLDYRLGRLEFWKQMLHRWWWVCADLRP